MDFSLEEPLMPYGIISMNPSTLIGYLHHFENDQEYLRTLKDKTNSTDDRIAFWLNMNVKTYRNHRDNGVALKPDNREQLIMLMSLAQHGIKVFGSAEAFGGWLENENFYLDGQKPAILMNTNSGIRLMDDHLTGIEYGDNA